MPRDGVLDSDTHTVFDNWIGQGRVFHFGRRDLIASDIDDIVLATREVEHAILVEETDVGSIDDTVSQYFRGSLGVSQIAGHQRVARTGDVSFGGDDDLRVFHGLAQTTGYTVAVVEVVGADDAGFGRCVGVIQPGVG